MAAGSGSSMSSEANPSSDGACEAGDKAHAWQIIAPLPSRSRLAKVMSAPHLAQDFRLPAATRDSPGLRTGSDRVVIPSAAIAPHLLHRAGALTDAIMAPPQRTQERVPPICRSFRCQDFR